MLRYFIRTDDLLLVLYSSETFVFFEIIRFILCKTPGIPVEFSKDVIPTHTVIYGN